MAVRVEGRPIKGDLELHDGAGFVFLNEEEKGRGAVHGGSASRRDDRSRSYHTPPRLSRRERRRPREEPVRGVEELHASLDQEQAYFERGELPDPRLHMTDITGAVEAAALEVALAPARTLEELTLKAEVADYFLGGLEEVEEALAQEKGKGSLQQLMALGLLRDLLRLPLGEGRPES